MSLTKNQLYVIILNDNDEKMKDLKKQIREYWVSQAPHFDLFSEDYRNPIVKRRFLFTREGVYDTLKDEITISYLSEIPILTIFTHLHSHDIVEHETNHKLFSDTIYSTIKSELIKKQNKKFEELLKERSDDIPYQSVKNKFDKHILDPKKNVNKLIADIHLITPILWNESLALSFKKSGRFELDIVPKIETEFYLLESSFWTRGQGTISECVEYLRSVSQADPEIRKFWYLGPLRNESLSQFEQVLQDAVLV